MWDILVALELAVLHSFARPNIQKSIYNHRTAFTRNRGAIVRDSRVVMSRNKYWRHWAKINYAGYTVAACLNIAQRGPNKLNVSFCHQSCGKRLAPRAAQERNDQRETQHGYWLAISLSPHSLSIHTTFRTTVTSQTVSDMAKSCRAYNCCGLMQTGNGTGCARNYNRWSFCSDCQQYSIKSMKHDSRCR